MTRQEVAEIERLIKEHMETAKSKEAQCRDAGECEKASFHGGIFHGLQLAMQAIRHEYNQKHHRKIEL